MGGKNATQKHEIPSSRWDPGSQGIDLDPGDPASDPGSPEILLLLDLLDPDPIQIRRSAAGESGDQPQQQVGQVGQQSNSYGTVGA